MVRGRRNYKGKNRGRKKEKKGEREDIKPKREWGERV